MFALFLFRDRARGRRISRDFPVSGLRDRSPEPLEPSDQLMRSSSSVPRVRGTLARAPGRHNGMRFPPARAPTPQHPDRHYHEIDTRPFRSAKRSATGHLASHECLLRCRAPDSSVTSRFGSTRAASALFKRVRSPVITAPKNAFSRVLWAQKRRGPSPHLGDQFDRAVFEAVYAASDLQALIVHGGA